MVFRATTTLFLVALQVVGALAGHGGHDPEMTMESRINKNKARPAIETTCEEGDIPFQMILKTGWQGYPRIQVQLMQKEDVNKAMPGSYVDQNFTECTDYVLPSEDKVMCLKPDRCYKFSIKDYKPTEAPTEAPTEVPSFSAPNEDVARKRDSYRNLQEEENYCETYEGSLTGYAILLPGLVGTMIPLFEASTDPLKRSHFFYCTAKEPQASEYGTLCQDKQDKPFKRRRKKTCESYLARNAKRKCQNFKENGRPIADICPLTCGRKEGIGPCEFLKKRRGMNMTRKRKMKTNSTTRRRRRLTA